MVQINDLRVGNLLVWNPKLRNPENTLPPTFIEVSAIFEDKVAYFSPSIEHRVEPFEDDRLEMETLFKSLNELEYITITPELIELGGFTSSGSSKWKHELSKGKMTIRKKEDDYEVYFPDDELKGSVKFVHQFQNLYNDLTGGDLEFQK